jgi:predicted phage-related endonuclease
VLSIKSSGLYTDDAKIWLAGECTDYARVQEQWVLWVTGRSHAWYIAIVDRRPVIVGPIERDEACIAELVAKAEMFWPYVTGKTPPPIDYASATPEEMLARFREVIHPSEIAGAEIPQQALADVARLAEIRGLAAQVRACGREERDIRTRLTLQIGEKEFLGVPDGQGGLKPIAHWKLVNQSKFRERDFKTAHPALAEEFTDKGKTRRLELIKDGAA